MTAPRTGKSSAREESEESQPAGEKKKSVCGEGGTAHEEGGGTARKERGRGPLPAKIDRGPLPTKVDRGPSPAKMSRGPLPTKIVRGRRPREMGLMPRDEEEEGPRRRKRNPHGEEEEERSAREDGIRVAGKTFRCEGIGQLASFDVCARDVTERLRFPDASAPPLRVLDAGSNSGPTSARVRSKSEAYVNVPGT